MNLWYAHPIGHAIEALRFCVGYAAADRSLHVAVALNGATPFELARLCAAVDEVFAIPFTDLFDTSADARAALAAVPREWDWVVDDGRRHQPEQLETFPGLRRYYQASDEHFVVRRGRRAAGQSPPPYVPNRRLQLALPQSARQRADDELGPGRPRVAVVPAGSG
ncbi:MAG TPA: hypothetical protein VE269_03945, partial [Gaiellaceae bacterium]|nr:hypothetical protein [Gaiellaceae bacterium]